MAYEFNPLTVGGEVGDYYNAALAKDPTMAAIQRNIAGRLNPDVANQLSQAAAERGLGIGSYGGGNDMSYLLRSLGTNSMALTNLGIEQYGKAKSTVPALNPTSLFISPTDQAKMDLEQRMLTEKIAAEKSLQTERLVHDSGQFSVARGDTLSGVAATNKRLDDMISRWNSGQPNASAGTGSSSGSSSSSGEPYVWGGFPNSPGLLQEEYDYFAEQQQTDKEFDYTGNGSGWIEPNFYTGGGGATNPDDWGGWDEGGYFDEAGSYYDEGW
jgi:hypothetical protein